MEILPMIRSPDTTRIRAPDQTESAARQVKRIILNPETTLGLESLRPVITNISFVLRRPAPGAISVRAQLPSTEYALW
jgi:hypothetical protein